MICNNPDNTSVTYIGLKLLTMPDRSFVMKVTYMDGTHDYWNFADFMEFNPDYEWEA